uniref:ATP synthase subunit a n=1 Tax=Scydmaeninae sp. BMNH 1274313 TaxID=1796549 RepID=A0A126TFA0_9COLE|nr:ATP synthase F0 subunit 6 [Scydmaeninae sp. BMNH 1274313]
MFSINWLSSMLGFMFIPLYYWLIPSRWSWLWINTLMILNQEFKTMNYLYKGNSLIFISMMTFILFNNILGLFPYIFTSSSHMSMSLSLSLPIWFSFILIGWLKTPINMMAHFVPFGTPTILMPMLVMVELISNLIRPGTLAIRLTANMMAGHLILTLLGNMNNYISFYLIIMLLILQIMFMVLEMSVAFIQSYVFSMLSSIYFKEMI